MLPPNDCGSGQRVKVSNLPNGIAAYSPANVANLAITQSGTMLSNGLESSNAQPAYFHKPQLNPA
jgi:hypothetical protein